MNKMFEFYKNIFTFDDFAFSNNILLPQTLGANHYVKYQNDISYLKEFINKKPDREIVNLENIFLFTFNRGKKSGGNFFHFHFHYMQKLIGYFLVRLSNKDIKLGIPLNTLPFQKKLILSLVNEDQIVYLDIYQFNYNISNGYIGKYIDIDKLPNILFNMYQNIGNKYIHHNLKFTNSEKIFIRRREGHGGDNRIMNNQTEMINYLDNYNFKYFYFEDHDIKEKILNLILLRPKLIIIEIGSGLTNLLYFPKRFFNNIEIIIIDQDNWRLEKSRLFDIIVKLDIKFKTLTCKNKINNLDNTQNNPFEINILNLNFLLENYI